MNHPFYPAWRALPIEVVPSDDEALTARMMQTLKRLGKVPLITADVPCFAADDIFCNYCAEAVRILAEGIANAVPDRRDRQRRHRRRRPFNVMDLTRGNLLGVHCLELMREAPTGSEWFTPPELLGQAGQQAVARSQEPGGPSYDEALARKVLDRMLAVLIGRTYFVVDNGICDPTDLDWLTRMALGFRKGCWIWPRSSARAGSRRSARPTRRTIRASRCRRASRSASRSSSIATSRSTRDGDIAVVTVFRPEVKNALNGRTMDELDAAFKELAADDAVRGVVLTSFDGSLAGADIMELAALKSAEEARGQVPARPGGPRPDLRDGQAGGRRPGRRGAGRRRRAEHGLSRAGRGQVVDDGAARGQPRHHPGLRRDPATAAARRPRAGSSCCAPVGPVGAKEACEMGWATGEPVAEDVGRRPAV